ncbi:putative quinol monooxygenase [Sinorhizobium sp. NFACC03]|uniref:putative quinol monooxygenase n=1 Tax=Sinorhizobium sp. NFACC03 TaxID=1566295 RepID=UPI00089196B1|nr:putative quinol monooxygenase [Sinorhizobium sp. NFACC03]SDA61640.1 Quinol monooxygenase YgiN [Sinorhizobium sp. NFACC03]
MTTEHGQGGGVTRRHLAKGLGAGALLTAAFTASANAQTAAGTVRPFELPRGAVTVVAYLQASGGRENKLAEISSHLMGEVRKNEPGNLLFQTHRGADVPGLILFYEIFATEEAFQAHKDAEHTKRWFREIEPLVASPIQVSVLRAV